MRRTLRPYSGCRYGQDEKCTVRRPRSGRRELGACIASLIETAKLHGVDPQAYIADVLTRLVNLWPASRLDELMP
jgi:IS66 C-terminal element